MLNGIFALLNNMLILHILLVCIIYNKVFLQRAGESESGEELKKRRK